MMRFTGEPCPVCSEKFKEGDDIVVCPECGTPYHRACWAKAGACVHAAEHAAGFEWQPRAGAGAGAACVCPNCGAHNEPGAAYCSHCGVPLGRDTAADRQNAPIYTRTPTEAPQPRASRAGAQPDGVRMAAYTAGEDGGIYRREVGPDDAIDGIKARDWASFVGRSSPYYLMQFFRMSATKRKTGVSFSVLLFGPGYFFYRKMWREGLLYAAALLLLGLPGTLLMLLDAGVLPAAGWNIGFLAMLAQVCAIASWAVTVAMCLLGVYLYKKSAAKRIREVYDRVPDGPDRADALALCGGTSLLAPALYMLALFLGSMAFAALLGPYVQTLLYGVTP